MDALDLNALDDSFQSLLAERWNVDAVRQFAQQEHEPYAQSLWDAAKALGWQGISIAQDYGGLGLGGDALMVLYRALGHALAAIPLLPSLLAADLIERAGGEEQRRRWLPAIAAGDLRATISPPHAEVSVHGRQAGDCVYLHGVAEELLDGAAADLILVRCDIDGEDCWAAIEPGGADMAPSRIDLTDRTRHLARIAFAQSAIPADRVIRAAASQEVADALLLHAALAIAADSVGGARAMLDRTVAYLKIREQFGRPIGSFQALKHRVADHHTALVAAAALVDDAAAQVAAGRGQLVDALAAKTHAAAVYAEIARDCIQLHGGIGYTWEYCAHLFLKRAKVNEMLFGSRADSLERMIRLLAA